MANLKTNIFIATIFFLSFSTNHHLHCEVPPHNNETNENNENKIFSHYLTHPHYRSELIDYIKTHPEEKLEDYFNDHLHLLYPYHIDEDFNKSTRVFGPLVVSPGEFQAEAKIKPWTSWWYPLWETTLFEAAEGEPSTLERYDQWVYQMEGKNPLSAPFEREHIYDQRAVGWAGRCDAWSLASILEPEPKQSVTLHGVNFRIRDLKALLLKKYEKVEGLISYGQRYNGEWNSVYEDIAPEQFHRFVEVELFEKKQPFIMDYDAGVEVWNAPVWKVLSKISESESDANIFHVKSWVFAADPHVRNLDFLGTQTVIYTYTYDLYGQRARNGSLVVTHGKWTGESRWNHPDYVVSMPKKNNGGEYEVKASSYNPQINLKYVDQIVKKGSANN